MSLDKKLRLFNLNILIVYVFMYFGYNADKETELKAQNCF